MKRFALIAAIICGLIGLVSSARSGSMMLLGVGGSGSAGGGLLLDNLSATPTAAYSTRKLRTAYAGFALRVIRSTDSATLDIGFVSNQLDSVSMLAFCGVINNSYCGALTWYDQSGNGHDQTPFNTPLIVSNVGTTWLINSHYTINFGTGSPNNSMVSSSVTISQPDTIVVAAQYRTLPASGQAAVLAGGGVTGSSPQQLMGVYTNPSSNWYMSTSLVDIVAGTPDTNPHESLAIFNGASSSYWVDNVSTVTGTIATEGIAEFTIGAYWSGIAQFESNANIGEVLLFNSVLSAGDMSAIHSSYQTQWGTP